MDRLISILTVVMISVSLNAYAQTEKEESPQQTVMFNEVTALFGDNLEPEPGALQDLLLAVAVDHTSMDVPDATREIGIPYILDKGIRYWASRLTKNAPLDVIVNNALFLLYAKDRTEESKKTALGLMKLAARKNYWPAKFFVAENNLHQYLSASYDVNTTSSMTIEEAKLKTIANTTMQYFNDCAKRGFAPCQYRVGTWLLADEQTVSDSLKALEAAINTSLNDSRYRGIFKDRQSHAALILISIGPQYGYKEEKITQFTNLLTKSILHVSSNNTK